ncbi:MAG: Gfo/Idh/MocA family oxidoreductase [Candidatus Glassbacteria bacterium]|nr:Gfo/Idh/MocA family oxidoreductase [Candidatus Glassbacteria bacterium]
MSAAFRFAVVGTGDIAGFYMDHFTRLDDKKNIEFAGAWNRTADRCRRFTGNYGGRAYTSLDELLGDSEVDAVVNLTSPKVHYDLTLRSLEAGKHVHTEKPLALSVEQGRKLIAAAAKKDIVLSSAPFILLGHNQREVKRLLAERRIGEPVSVTAELYHGRVEAWHPSPEQFYTAGGGPLLDVGPYPVSLLLDWFGPVAEVTGMFDIAIPERADLNGRKFTVTTFDNGVALLRFASGVTGRIAFSYANSNTDHHGLEIQGTAGSLALGSVMAARGELKISEKDSAKWDVVVGEPGPFEASGVDWSGGIMELASAVGGNREPLNSARLALETLEVLLAIERAATERCVVKL